MTLGQSSIVEVFVYHLSAKTMKLRKDIMIVLLKIRHFLQDRLVSIDLGFIIIICLVCTNLEYEVKSQSYSHVMFSKILQDCEISDKNGCVYGGFQ